MSQYGLIAAGALVATALAGCGTDGQSIPSDEGDTITKPAQSDEQSAASKPSATITTSKDSPPTQDSSPNKTNESLGQQEPHSVAQADAPPTKSERFLVLTPGGPLVIDASITINGRPHTEVHAELIQRVLDAADTDDDGQPTWAEWSANEEFLRGDLSNIDPDNKRLINMWVERFDENGDKWMQSEEAAAWLGRDSGSSVRPLALRSRRSYLPIPSRNSRVWDLLDADRNNRLDGDEIAAAADRLWSLDADDDRTINTAEMASLRDLLDAAAPAMTFPYDDTRHAAIQLEPESDFSRLQYLLGDLYAPRQNLGPSSFPDLPKFFERLDTNSDGWLEHAELSGLLTIEPHLELRIAFVDVGSLGLPPASVEVNRHADDVVVTEGSAPNRLLASLGSSRLIISANDLAGYASYGRDARQNELRLMVHDQCDALFEEVDANADGRLGEREITTSSEQLVAQDASGHGTLTSGELPNFMIVAFLRGEAPNEQSFYTPAVAAASSTSRKGPHWFVSADFNGDGDVSRREFLGSADKFAQLDTDANGFISSQEALEVSAESP